MQISLTFYWDIMENSCPKNKNLWNILRVEFKYVGERTKTFSNSIFQKSVLVS